jgi:hypothetical protein
MLDQDRGVRTKSRCRRERLPRLDVVGMFALAQDILKYAAQVKRSRSSGARPLLASALCSSFSVLRFSMSFPLSDLPVGDARWFPTTHWSVVLAAGGDDSTEGAQAMERLSRTYRAPLYAYPRRDGYEKLPRPKVETPEVVSSQQPREEFPRQVLRLRCRTHAARTTTENCRRGNIAEGGYSKKLARSYTAAPFRPPETRDGRFFQKPWRDLHRDLACQRWWAERTSPENT